MAWGHAVYTLSDPREVILKDYAKRLSEEKGMQREYELYERVERLAGEAIARKRHLFKPICANVDFYSGFVYSMLGIPEELYTPIFAISRISGWSAHRLEEVVNNGKIIRPAYKYVGHHRSYIELDDRRGIVVAFIARMCYNHKKDIDRTGFVPSWDKAGLMVVFREKRTWIK